MTLQVVLLADSVIGGSGGKRNAIEEFSLGGARECAADVNTLNLSSPGCTVIDQLASLDTTVECQPDLIIVAHGGYESLLVLRGGHRGTADHAGNTAHPADHEQRLTVHRRRLGGHRIPVLRGARRLLLQFVGKPRVDLATFTSAYRLLIAELVARTTATIVLFDFPVADSTYVPHEPRGVEVRGLQEALGAEFGERVILLEVQPSLRAIPGWDAFASDRAHINDLGRAIVCEKLRRELQCVHNACRLACPSQLAVRRATRS